MDIYTLISTGDIIDYIVLFLALIIVLVVAFGGKE